MARKTKKILSLALILSLLMSMFNVNAFAATNSDQIVNSGGAKYYSYEGKAVTSGSANHYVTATKTIAATGTENLFDITLKVETKKNTGYDEVKKDAAVVLTIDLSNTMLEYCMTHAYNCSCSTQRIDIAAAKAKEFITSYGQEGEREGTARYLAVVMFSGPAQTYVNWVDVSNSSNRNTVLAAMDKLESTSIWKDGYRGGQTNVEGGLQLSYDLLQSKQASTDIDKSYCILLSDGSPTAHIKVAHDKNAAGQYYYVCRSGNCSGTTCNSGDGTGSSVNTPDYTRAEAAAKKVKSLPNTQLYAIAVAGSAWLNKIDGTHDVNGKTAADWLATITGSSDRVISGDNETGVKNAFSTINTAIKTETIPEATWAKAVKVSDILPANMQLVSLPSGASHNSSNCTITWNINASDNGTHTLTYRVRLMTGISGYTAGAAYPANEKATVTYTMMSKYGSTTETGASHTKEFAVPTVKGYKGTLTFNKKASHTNAALADCTFTLKHNLGSGCTCGGAVTIQDISAKSTANGTVTFDSIPSGHKFTLYETAVPSGYTAKTATSTVTVSYGSTSVSGSLLSAANGTVVNDPDSQPATFTVKKEWKGNASVDSISVGIYKKGTNSKVADLTLSKPNWTASVTLPTIDVATKTAITYEAREVDGSNYKLLSGGDFNSNRVATLTNVIEGKTSVTIQKTWTAPGNLQPAVTVRLLQNGNKVGDYTLSSGNGWKQVISNLEQYDNAGGTYTYSVVELDAGGNMKSDGNTITLNGHNYTVGISKNGSTYTVSNAIQQEYTSVSGTKTWKVDSLSAEEKAALNATITLYRDGTAIDTRTVTYDNTNYSFTNLPIYNGNSRYTYSVEETAVSRADVVKTAATANNTGGKNFTNTLVGTTSVSGTKTWVDTGADAPRPNSITINLLRNGSVCQSTTLNATLIPGTAGTEGVEGEESPEGTESEAGTAGTPDTYEWTSENLSYSFSGLDKYDANGKLYNYSVQEVLPAGSLYTVTYSGFDVTNTLNGGEKTIAAQKLWVDAEADHEAVQVGVYRQDTNENVAVLTLNEDNGWSAQINLTKYESGTELNYYVRELDAAGAPLEEGAKYGSYTVNYSSSQDIWTVKNTIDQDYVNISGQKTWIGTGDHPDVTFTLYKNGVSTGLTRVQNAEVNELDAEGRFTFEGLEKYTFVGNTCTVNQYTIQETMTGTDNLLARYYYTGAVNGTSDEYGVFQFVNEFHNDVTEISGQKTWYAYTFPTGEVNVGLFVGETLLEQKTTENLQFEFENLTKYNPDGTLIGYYIRELDEQGAIKEDGSYYTTSDGKQYVVKYNGTNIDNTLKQEYIDIPVTKVWRGPKAAEITFELYRTDDPAVEPVKVDEITLTDADLNSENGYWEGAFSNHDVYNPSRTAEYIYSVKEVGAADGKYTANGFTYTAEEFGGNIFRNTIDDPNNGTYTVTKQWAGDGYTQETGEDVTVQLYIDNVAYGNPVTLGISNEWTYTWTDLPCYDDTSFEAVTYSVKELYATGAPIQEGEAISLNGDTERYTVSYDGGVITNTFKERDAYFYRVLRHYTMNVDGYVTTYVDNDTEWTVSSEDNPVDVDASQWTDCRTDQYNLDYTFAGRQTNVFQGANGGYHHTLNDKVVKFVTEKYVNGENYYEVQLYYNFTYISPPGFTSLSVEKVWIDNNDEAGLRPAGIQVELLENGRATGNVVTLSEANGWKHTWEQLTDTSVWSATEINVPEGYTSSVSKTAGSVVVTNTLIPIEYTSLSVQKVWDDDNNAAGVRPESIQVELLKSGTATGNVVTLSDENNWGYTFSKLSPEEQWSVAEINVPEGYTSSVFKEDDSVVVTNTYIPPVVPEEPEEEPEVEVMEPDVPMDGFEEEEPMTEIDVDDIPKSGLELEDEPIIEAKEDIPLTNVPKTADDMHMNMWMFLALLSAGAMIAGTVAGRKEEE